MADFPLCTAFTGLLMLATAPTALANDDITAKFSGRLYYEFAHFDNDTRGPAERSGDDLRAAWLGVAGKVHSVGYKLEADFAGHRPVARDVYLTHKIGTALLTVGQFKQFYTLDDRSSANHTPTIERSFLVQSLGTAYRLGIGAQGNHAGIFWSGSVFSLESIDVWQAKGHVIGGRVGHAPWQQPGHVLHFGVSGAHEHHSHPGTDGALPLRAQARTTGHYGDNGGLPLVDFRSGRAVSVNRYSVETAGVSGPWSWQAEYGGARYDDGQQRGEVQAGYLQGSWLLTGETRPYDPKGGRFIQLEPEGDIGAWELVARYDRINGRQWPAQQRDVTAEAWTLGVNWYASSKVRLMLDWTDSRRRDELRGQTLDHTGVLAGRAQLHF